jgi:hypothetical protein
MKREKFGRENRTGYLINFMVLRPFREAAISAASQELPSILWNTRVHFHVHKSPPLAFILT